MTDLERDLVTSRKNHNINHYNEEDLGIPRAINFQLIIASITQRIVEKRNFASSLSLAITLKCNNARNETNSPM